MKIKNDFRIIPVIEYKYLFVHSWQISIKTGEI